MVAHIFEIVVQNFLIFTARTLRGRKLGEGGSRIVFTIIGTRCLVLKWGKFLSAGNRNEWHIWKAIEHSKIAHLFARCYAISSDGRYLLMERVRNLNKTELKNRTGMPVWVTDRKPSAYGAANNGDIKLRDYGVTNECNDYANAPLINYPSDDDIDEMKRLRDILNKL